jgi:stearoyl-CoA desaturase (delta-9 desaturase)
MKTLVPYVLVHVACLGALWTGIDRRALYVFLGCLFLRTIGLTICLHRYFAHRSFKTSRAMQLCLAIVGSLTLQGGILWWAETHRRHHRNADTPDDLHSPHYQGFFYSHFGWFMDRRNTETRHDKVPDLARYPELVWLDDHPAVPFAIFAVVIGALFGLSGLVWGVFIPTVILWEITHWVQSFSHSWGGYRRWPSDDQSRNHWLLALVAFGEFHNNHHQFPSSARQGHVWWEFDLGYWILRSMSAVGLVWDLKIPPELSARRENQ